MLNIPKHHTVRRQRGFSLVEVLIALVIMSVGMLGIAGLYVQSMQAGRTSLFRHHAVNLAGDVADRIRANPTAGASYAIDGGTDNNCDGAAANCDADTMAANDVFLWEEQADDTLPNGDVAVTFDNTVVPPSYTITVTWDEAGASQQPTFAITIPVNGA